MTRKICISLFCILAYVVATFAKGDPIHDLLKKLEAYVKKMPAEKVHLHLDKPYYAIGEDIWFKAYILDAHTNNISKASQTLYAELIDENLQVSKRLVLQIINGQAIGDFDLRGLQMGGNYRIRAYTNAMRNHGPAFFFDKTIKIGDVSSNQLRVKTEFTVHETSTDTLTQAHISLFDVNGKAYENKKVAYQTFLGVNKIDDGETATDKNGLIRFSFPKTNEDRKLLISIELESKSRLARIIPIKAANLSLDVQFFPEGGKLVNGLISRVGVKSINGNGLGQNISGKIIASDGVTVANFQTKHLGMGDFVFRPEKGKSYVAKVNLPNGNTKQINLPQAENSGPVIIVRRDKDNLNVRISCNDKPNATDSLTLLAHRNGKVFAYASIPASTEPSAIELPLEQFPSGILQLTLFAGQVPKCERIVFLRHTRDTFDPNIQQLKSRYQKGELIDVFFNPTVENSNWAEFSVAVTNNASVSPDVDNESHLLASMLLKSDLAGYIERPNYYFLNDDEQTRQNLDLLMLTQGWRKINWTSVSASNPNASFEIETGLKISGSVTFEDGRPVENAKLNLLAKSGKLFTADTLSNAQGKFEFKHLTFSDSTKFMIQAKTKKDKKDLQIKLDLPANVELVNNKNIGDIDTNVNSSLATYLEQQKPTFDEQKRLRERAAIQLKEVKIAGVYANPAKNSKNLNGPGVADQVIDVSALKASDKISKYLQGRALGVEVRWDGIRSLKLQTTKTGKGENFVQTLDPRMQIILDGTLMSVDFNIDEINPLEVESIEILNSISKIAVYGGNATRGLIIVTTKNPGSARNYTSTIVPGVTTFTPKGYDNAREFYIPKYTVENNNTPDLRSTVYWNPSVVTDQHGKAKFSYQQGNRPGTYRMLVEGIDAFGNLARKVYTYEVN